MFLHKETDFGRLYEKLKIADQYIHGLCITLTPTNNMKSGYYYICSVLSRMKNIKNLVIKCHGISEVNLKALKGLAKGLNNFSKNGGKLEILDIQKFNHGQVTDTEELFNRKELVEAIFGKIKEIKKLKISNSLVFISPELIDTFLEKTTSLVEVELSNSIQNYQDAEKFANGLMHSRKIKSLTIRKNSY